MQKTDAQQLLLDILKPVEEGKFTEFHFITSWNDFRFYRQSARATKLIIRTLKASSQKVLEDYCSEVSSGNANINKLLAYTKLCEAIAFYKKELATMKLMIKDYDEYLGQGNFWFSFLGGERII